MGIVSATGLSCLYARQCCLDTEDHTVSDLDDNLVFPFHDAVPIIVVLGVAELNLDATNTRYGFFSCKLILVFRAVA